METYPAMNKRICEMLRVRGFRTDEYAALRIEELEQQLAESERQVAALLAERIGGDHEADLP